MMPQQNAGGGPFMKEYFAQINKRSHRPLQKAMSFWWVLLCFFSLACGFVSADEFSWNIARIFMYSSYAESFKPRILSSPFCGGGQQDCWTLDAFASRALITGLNKWVVPQGGGFLDLTVWPCVQTVMRPGKDRLNDPLHLCIRNAPDPLQGFDALHHKISESLSLSPYFHHELGSKSPGIGLGMQLILKL
jgi:hypothetical protein